MFIDSVFYSASWHYDISFCILSHIVFCCVTVYSLISSGLNKVDEKLKVGRTKRLEGALFNEVYQTKHLTLVPAKRKAPCQGE